MAGQILRDEGYVFDHVFTSQLSRAQDTVQIILQELNQSPEVTKSWRLNERHYGDLTGYNKLEMANKYGLEQVEFEFISATEVIVRFRKTPKTVPIPIKSTNYRDSHNLPSIHIHIDYGYGVPIMWSAK